MSNNNALAAQLRRAFAPFEAFATTSDLRHATLYPANPNDGLTPALVDRVCGNAPFRHVTYPSWRAEIFYGRLEDDHRAFVDASMALMDCIRHRWDDGEHRFIKAVAADTGHAPYFWMDVLYRAAAQDDDPLLSVGGGRLVAGRNFIVLEGGGSSIHLEPDDKRWEAARFIMEHERHRFIASRRNVFLLTRYAIEQALVAEDAPAPSAVAARVGYASPADLAERHSLTLDALRKRLDRWRKANAAGGGFVQNTERGPREPAFLYDPEHPGVMQVLEQARQASSERPAKKS